MGYGPENISVNLFLSAVPGDRANFGIVGYLVPLASNSLDGDRTRLYASAQDAQDDFDSGFISSTTLQAANDYFAQAGSRRQLRVGYVDLVGAEDYGDGIDEMIADAGEKSFWGVAIQSRADADILAACAKTETLGYYFVVYQSDDADWLTASYPAALTAQEGRERCALSFHDTDAENSDLAVLGRFMEVDPDAQSVKWSDNIKEVLALATALTTTQKGFLQGNEGNTGVTWSPATFWWGTGINHANRPIDHILGADWFVTRLEEDLRDGVQAAAARNEKITVDVDGQSFVLAIIEARIRLGINAGHFLEISPTDPDKKTEATPLEITAADVTAARVRFNVNLISSTGVDAITVNVYQAAQ